MAAAQVGIGAIQTGIAASKASQLPAPQQYSVGPEMAAAYRLARKRSTEGHSEVDKAVFGQMLAKQTTATKQMYRNMGHGFAGSAAAAIMNLDIFNQFAQRGEDVRRQNEMNFYGMSGQIQNIQNMEVQRQNQRLMAEEQALGGAIQAGIGNMFKGFDSGMNFMKKEDSIDTYDSIGQ